MRDFDDVVRLHRLQHMDLQAWIDHRWVRPRVTAEGLRFDEIDEARIAFICELRRDFSVGDDALEVLLPVLDQLYAARRVLKRVEAALETLPEPMRAQIRERIGAIHDDEPSGPGAV